MADSDTSKHCTSCGENAVIQTDIEGEGTKSICVECGTVDSSPPSQEHQVTHDDEVVCESCGIPLQLSCPESLLQLCLECQSAEEDSQTIILSDTAFPATNQEIETDKSTLNPAHLFCTFCGSKEVRKDSLGTDEHNVCADCGSVVEGQVFMSENSGCMQRSPTKGFTLPRGSQRKMMKGLKAGFSKISILSDVFHLSGPVMKEAKEMFEKVNNKKNVYFCYSFTKEHLAAACLYVVCRSHGIPISPNHFKAHLENMKLFLRMKRMVVDNLSINLPVLTLSSYICSCLDSKGFKPIVIEKVKDIVFLMRRAWLTEGYHREGIIIMAAYFAFMSTTDNEYMSMSNFISLFKLPRVPSLLEKKIRRFLLRLAKAIPWISKVIPRYLYMHIDDILKYQASLFQLAFDCDDSGTDTNQASSWKHKFRPCTKESLLPSALKKKKREPEPVSYESAIPPHVDLHSSEVKDTDFDEVDINSYLLTDDEMEKLRPLKMKNFQ